MTNTKAARSGQPGAGPRSTTLPHAVIPDLRRHPGNVTGAEPDALIFTGKRAGVLWQANFRHATKWGELLTKLSVPSLHAHHLRHTGNTLPTEPAATLPDLMEWMCHDSARAAMIHQTPDATRYCST